MLYIVGMCIALPITLVPIHFLYKLRIINRMQKERISLSLGKFCARWMLRLIPFCHVDCITDDSTSKTKQSSSSPVPSIWVCNHTSMLDVFLLLAKDRQLRQYSYQRPIKIVYWKTLEKNIISKLLFTMSGFIPVSMVANAPGEDNQYDRKSFKQLLQQCKAAFADGYDVGILPEGQLNPAPELGLLPVFSGAYTLAKMSQRPIKMLALYNIHNLWHPVQGMIGTKRQVKIRCYENPTVGERYFTSAAEFIATFETVVGTFGRTGTDVTNIQDWLSGTAYQQQQQLEQQQQQIEEQQQQAQIEQIEKQQPEETVATSSIPKNNVNVGKSTDDNSDQ